MKLNYDFRFQMLRQYFVSAILAVRLHSWGSVPITAYLLTSYLRQADFGSRAGCVTRKCVAEKTSIRTFSKPPALLRQNTVAAKLANTKSVVKRTLKDYPQIDEDGKLTHCIERLDGCIKSVYITDDYDGILGTEGNGAKAYFDVFDSLILHQKDDFCFAMRSKRPPLDRVNAMLSFLYTIFTREYAAALESVGLDSYMGFYHSLRPGRESLACDLVEEGRCIVERFVLTLINLKIIKPEDFDVQLSGAVFLNDGGRKKVLSKWQEKKRTDMIHPYLKEKFLWDFCRMCKVCCLQNLCVVKLTSIRVIWRSR